MPNSFFKLLTAVFVDKDCLDKYAIINISKAPTKTITHIILSKRPLYILVVSTSGKDNDFILSDTVGFISELPIELIEAFKATLDEIVYADLILHVRDISHKDYNSQNTDVLEIVSNIFGYDINQIPTNYIDVINKIDNLDKNNYKNTKNKVYISAKTGEGINNLMKIINMRINVIRNKKKYY